MSDGVSVTLGSVVSCGGEYGVVWHATGEVLRVLPIQRATSSVRLSLANEVALHLPVSLGGWSVGYDEMVAWPRSLCSMVGELDESCLLKILQARKAAAILAVAPAVAAAARAVSEAHAAA